jgi:hypothetical protein
MTTPRHHSHTRSLLATVAVAIPVTMIGFGLSAPPARAGYIVDLTQVGSNVVATGSGTIDLTDLSHFGTGTNGALISPGDGVIITGPQSPATLSLYTGFTGPANFGSSNLTFANSGSGDAVGINHADNNLEVFEGYLSGASLSDTSTYANQTFGTLGAYVWTWGTGAHADSFTLQIGPAAVPAPLIGRGLPIFLAVGGLLFAAKLLERSKQDSHLG